MIWFSQDNNYIVLSSNIKKAKSIQLNMSKNPLISSEIFMQDNILYFEVSYDNASFHEEIDWNEIIREVFEIDNDADIYSCSKTSAECSYGIYYSKYYYNNEIVIEEYQDNYIEAESFNDQIETIESYIVKHYLSMLDYVGNMSNSDEYGYHKCKCLFCGKECEVYEDEKDKFDFRPEESYYSCYNCGHDYCNLDLIQLNMKKKNINYEKSLNELFCDVMKKYLKIDNAEKDKALKEFRNIINNDEYQLSRFDEHYNNCLNLDKIKKNKENFKKENNKRAYIKKEYNKLYKKIKSSIYVKLPDDANPFI